MNSRTIKTIGLIFALTMFGIALVTVTPIARAKNPNAAPNVTANWITTGNKTGSGDFLGTKNNQPLIFKTNKVERLRIDSSGKVGIGTNAPSERLMVQTATNSYGIVHTDGTVTVGTWVGAGSVGKDSGWIGTKTNHPLRFFTNDAGAAMTLSTSGEVQIGGYGSGSLRVIGADTSGNTSNFLVQNSNFSRGLQVWNDGKVAIGKLDDGASTTHVCLAGGGNFLSKCGSAAEYVPAIDNGSGFPETADLVSIAPSAANPYGDAHGPFVVTKSEKACDDNLLGFIVKPESGADGVKKNDHYLPLAIYGYFPAKVTMENGVIHRGDALTSSSKAGYAMKATSACKIIGYALDDANANGQIQVFANTGESTASEVTTLRAQVDALTQENQSLKQMLAEMDTRLKALEQTSPVAQAR